MPARWRAARRRRRAMSPAVTPKRGFRSLVPSMMATASSGLWLLRQGMEIGGAVEPQALDRIGMHGRAAAAGLRRSRSSPRRACLRGLRASARRAHSARRRRDAWRCPRCWNRQSRGWSSSAPAASAALDPARTVGLNVRCWGPVKRPGSAPARRRPENASKRKRAGCADGEQGERRRKDDRGEDAEVLRRRITGGAPRRQRPWWRSSARRRPRRRKSPAIRRISDWRVSGPRHYDIFVATCSSAPRPLPAEGGSAS